MRQIKVSRKTTRTTLSCLVIGWFLLNAGEAEPVTGHTKVHDISILLVGTPDYPTLKGLISGLNDAGYLPGKNLVLDLGVKTSYDDIRAVAKSYREKKADVVVAFGETTTAIAMQEIPHTPIVFIHAID